MVSDYWCYKQVRSGQRLSDLLSRPCKPIPPVSWSASNGVAWSQGFVNTGFVPGAALHSPLEVGLTSGTNGCCPSSLPCGLDIRSKAKGVKPWQKFWGWIGTQKGRMNCIKVNGHLPIWSWDPIEAAVLKQCWDCWHSLHQGRSYRRIGCAFPLFIVPSGREKLLISVRTTQDSFKSPGGIFILTSTSRL